MYVIVAQHTAARRNSGRVAGSMPALAQRGGGVAGFGHTAAGR